MMSNEYGWFVYGLIDTGDWTDEGSALSERLTGVPGVAPESGPEVHRFGRLGVLASAVPLQEYAEPELEQNLENLEWLESRARAHAAVIAVAFELQPVLPLRFGTLYSSLESMADALGPRESEFLEGLTATRDQEEWTVRLCANPDHVAQQMATEATSAAAGAGAGTQYLLRRKLALQSRSGVTENLVNQAAEGHTDLEGHALHSVPARTEVSGLPGGARSLLSRVYTIRRADRQRFLTELDQVRTRMTGLGIAVLQSGPWPPAIGHSPAE